MKQITSLPTPGMIDIDIFTVNNYDNVRGRTMSSSKANSRTTLMSLSISSEPYYENMEHFNDLPNKEFREPVNSFQLSYDNNRGE